MCVCVCVCMYIYIYVVVLYAIPSHNTHVLLAAIVCVIIGLHTHLWLYTCLSHITHIFLSWTVSVLLAQSKHFSRVNCLPWAKRMETVQFNEMCVIRGKQVCDQKYVRRPIITQTIAANKMCLLCVGIAYRTTTSRVQNNLFFTQGNLTIAS